MLINKDSVTRVYYGDLYREDGHYMAKKTPYFDAIDTLLRARIKYVAGGQDMEVKKTSIARITISLIMVFNCVMPCVVLTTAILTITV